MFFGRLDLTWNKGITWEKVNRLKVIVVVIAAAAASCNCSKSLNVVQTVKTFKIPADARYRLNCSNNKMFG